MSIVRRGRKTGSIRRRRGATSRIARAQAGEATGMAAFHQRQVAMLGDLGFRVSPHLPVRESHELRPASEIARRLLAIKCLLCWVCVPKDQVATALIQDCISRNRLASVLSTAEKAIFQVSRQVASSEHIDDIGWRFENAWPLAWILGYDPQPEIHGIMLEGEQIKDLLIDFAPGLTAELHDWLTTCTLRDEQEVAWQAHTFICLHNAVRSAQLGQETVPSGFHPVLNGGVIHERRHAFSWALSPGVSWDDTDLAT